eukprot:Gregarina_sp_Poly_1__6996@NODE_3809_length_874_cov_6_399009_g2452_i0_p3_GENE_NODE_3809_length_874_cov_6_399009_g2452_i0NODE_3809_length_874_cov_6_399009_g2452_i0_p3_ORF_typecomplete_len120_score2_38Proho_convert/PF12177_8/0_033_NODE_3809_length_874_cov_6_399009_g2452_i017376
MGRRLIGSDAIQSSRTALRSGIGSTPVGLYTGISGLANFVSRELRLVNPTYTLSSEVLDSYRHRPARLLGALLKLLMLRVVAGVLVTVRQLQIGRRNRYRKDSARTIGTGESGKHVEAQ